MTLNGIIDLTAPVGFRADYVKVVEDTPILSAAIM